MTFLCTVAGELTANVPHGEYEPGVWGWPKPWALRCDGCGVIFDYGAGGPIEQTGPDQHTCTLCRRAPEGQLVLPLGAAA